MLSYFQTIHLYFLLFMRVTSNKDLQMIHNRAFQVKIKFNPGPTKSAQEVIFKSKTKKKKLPHLPSAFIHVYVAHLIYQKHLVMTLGSNLTI